MLDKYISKEKCFFIRTPRDDYSNGEVVLGRITSNTNKMSDSRDETLCHQIIALVKIILKAEMCWFVMY